MRLPADVSSDARGREAAGPHSRGPGLRSSNIPQVTACRTELGQQLAYLWQAVNEMRG